jgi:uncharacterized protein (DUF488 family)
MIFTIGYEGLGIDRFLEILKDNSIRTLLDCRYNAISMNPDFSKNRLDSHLKTKGIGYEHLRHLGIPGEIRKAGNAIEWYIENVMPNIHASVIDRFEQPVCFMCMEADVRRCHRKIILDAFREQGFEGRDLYPIRQ